MKSALFLGLKSRGQPDLLWVHLVWKRRDQCTGTTLTLPLEKSYQLHFCGMKIKVRWFILKLCSVLSKDNNDMLENTFLTFYFIFVGTHVFEWMWHVEVGDGPGSQLSPSRVGAGDWSVFRLGSKGLLNEPSHWPLEKNLFLLCIEHDELTQQSWLIDLPTPSQTWC